TCAGRRRCAGRVMRRPWAIPWDLLVTQNTAIVSRLPPPAPTRSVRRASGFVQTPVTETGTGDSSAVSGARRPRHLIRVPRQPRKPSSLVPRRCLLIAVWQAQVWVADLRKRVSHTAISRSEEHTSELQ